MARGRICHAITFTDDVTTTGSATQLLPLGTMRMEETSLTIGVEVYRYIQYSKGTNSVAAAAGALAYVKTQGQPWLVTGDSQTATTDGGLVKVVLQSVLADTFFGWGKTKGYQSNLKCQTGTRASFAKGDAVRSDRSTTATGKAMAIKATTTTKLTEADLKKNLSRVIGFAAAAKSTTTATGAVYVELE